MNIYINKDNTNRLAKENNKSGLINHLLEEYYRGLEDKQGVRTTQLPKYTPKITYIKSISTA